MEEHNDYLEDEMCPDCGHENPADNYSCDACGAEFCEACHPGSGEKCPDCGEELP